MRKLQALYAIVCCDGSNEMALVDLKRRLGETVHFERWAALLLTCHALMQPAVALWCMCSLCVRCGVELGERGGQTPLV